MPSKGGRLMLRWEGGGPTAFSASGRYTASLQGGSVPPIWTCPGSLTAGGTRRPHRGHAQSVCGVIGRSSAPECVQAPVPGATGARPTAAHTFPVGLFERREATCTHAGVDPFGERVNYVGSRLV